MYCSQGSTVRAFQLFIGQIQFDCKDMAAKLKVQQSSIFNYSKPYQQWHKLLTFEDSLSPVPNYPFCTLGVLTAEGKWGTKKGIAFIVQDNYLITSASNCYSHQHGEYPDINFSINSNRKHGYDNYNISKVFIPQQYKRFSQKQRKAFNYALLYIAEQPNLKDKYGIIEMHRKGLQLQNFNCEEGVPNISNQIKFVSEYLLRNYPSVNLSGSPFMSQMLFGQRIVDGIIVQHNSESYSSLLWFDDRIQSQLERWIEKRGKREISFTRLKWDEFDQIKLTGTTSQPIQIMKLNRCQLNEQQFNKFFNRLRSKSISILSMTLNYYSVPLTFLSQKKFKDLKGLYIKQSKIDSLGCKKITGASLNYLRVLELSYNQIGNEGCKYLSMGKWPFLQKLELTNCDIWNEGLQFLCRTRWTNLNWFNVAENNMNNDSSLILERADYPQIQTLDISANQITWEGLNFLKSPPWKFLKNIALCIVFTNKLSRQSDWQQRLQDDKKVRNHLSLRHQVQSAHYQSKLPFWCNLSVVVFMLDQNLQKRVRLTIKILNYVQK